MLAAARRLTSGIPTPARPVPLIRMIEFQRWDLRSSLAAGAVSGVETGCLQGEQRVSVRT